MRVVSSFANSIATPIPYFREDVIPRLTAAAVEAMTEETFASRPFAWRGRAPIMRNLVLLESEKET